MVRVINSSLADGVANLSVHSWFYDILHFMCREGCKYVFLHLRKVRHHHVMLNSLTWHTDLKTSLSSSLGKRIHTGNAFSITSG